MKEKRRTVSFSDIAKIGSQVLNRPETGFNLQDIRDGNAVHAQVKDNLKRGVGIIGIEIPLGVQPVFERRFALEVEQGLFLTAQPDVTYEGQRDVLLIEAKKREKPVASDFLQIAIAMLVVKKETGKQVTAQIYYHASKRTLDINDSVLDNPQVENLFDMARTAYIIKLGEIARKQRGRHRLPLEVPEAEVKAKDAYLLFSFAVRQTANRGLLNISNQFIDAGE